MERRVPCGVFPVCAAAVVLCMAAAGSRAQTVTATTVAGSSLLTTADWNGTAVGASSVIPAGTVLDAGTGVQMSATGAFGTAQASVAVSPLAVERYAVETTFAVQLQVQANAWFSRLGATCGSGQWWRPNHDVSLQVIGQRRVRARLRVSWNGSAGSESLTTQMIDIGDDGSREFHSLFGPWPTTPPVVEFGPGSLPIRITNYASGGLSHEQTVTGATSTLTVRLEPDSDCSATTVAPACGTAGLQMRENFTFGVDAIAQGLRTPEQGLSVLVVGLGAASATLPLPPGCVLGVTPDAVRWLQADGAGAATYSLSDLPAQLRPFSFWLQALDLDAATMSVQATEVVRVDCR